MEAFSEAYKSRCIRRLKEWGAPVEGWQCIQVYDVAGDDDSPGAAGLFTCGLCDCPKVQIGRAHV